jgi:RNA-splicing ligase RtcB
MSRLRFGNIGPSTHFLELQEVEDILDPAAAAELGIHPGQVTVQFHNGGGVLTGQLGALYARRKSASRMLRAEMSVQRPLSHLLPPRSGLRRRLAAYFTEGCPAVPVDGDDGRRVLLATRLAMNYGFAYRMATYAELRRMAHSAFGTTARLVVDSPHNSIYEETVDGTHACVHRHNACRAYPAALMKDHPAFARTGQPLLPPGTNRTSSYLACRRTPPTAASTPPATAPAASSPPSSAPAAPGPTQLAGPRPATATTAPPPPRCRIWMTAASTRRSAS